MNRSASKCLLALTALALAMPIASCSLKVDRSALSRACDSGACETAAACDGGACDAAAVCDAPACCLGCWDGTRCRKGDQPAACGKGPGVLCSTCDKEAANACSNGTCTTTAGLLGVSASARHTCAADTRKSLWCWGDNTAGQLGTEDALLDRPKVVTTGDWIDVAAGGGARGHTCAIHFAGSLWCWGDNARGQLGLGDERSATSRPTSIGSSGWRSVAAGDAMTCAVREDGGLYCWGANDEGQLGTADGDARTPRNVGFERDWRVVTARGAHACAIKEESGGLWCWGSNEHGQLGRSDVAVGAQAARPGAVASGDGYAQASAGLRHTCGVRTNGTLWCWGDGRQGQVGDGGNASARVPAAVGGTGGWAQVAAGGAHTCAVTTGGDLFCWGANDEGQLGTGAVGSAASLPAQVGAGTPWRRVMSGEQHTCAEARDGTFACWGSGAYGQTGTGRELRPTPTVVTWSRP